MLQFVAEGCSNTIYIYTVNCIVFSTMEKNKDHQPVNRALLAEYGFEINEKKTKDHLTILSKDAFDIVIKEDDSVFYSNMGFDYPLKDLFTLKKVYKEVRRKELK